MKHCRDAFKYFCSLSDGSIKHRGNGPPAASASGLQAVAAACSASRVKRSTALLTDDKKGTLTVRAVITLQLQQPAASGDETVPADRSAGGVSLAPFSTMGKQGEAATAIRIAMRTSTFQRQCFSPSPRLLQWLNGSEHEQKETGRHGITFRRAIGDTCPFLQFTEIRLQGERGARINCTKSSAGRPFLKTKLVCFGRYALSVPEEAQMLWGDTSFPSKIYVFEGGEEAVQTKIAKDIAKLKFFDDEADITYNDKGPVEGSWQFRYYEDKAAKEFNLHLFNTYIAKGNLFFLIRGGVEGTQTEEQAVAQQAARARSLRLRVEDDVPSEPGYCLEHGFMASSAYDDQEMVNVGMYLPSLPDVTFSISSNKDAYADYPKAEFEKMELGELSLLARIRSAQEEQGVLYPHRTVLREGKRNVQHWHGEESLIRRPDGVHDFEWGSVGTPMDVANPAELIVNLYTKVENNTVGAAKSASLSDEEAIALWDKLLSGLKFRVKVPGAPIGSYYLPQATPQDHGTK
jgi:hypothetical protein